jgi:hypothetical protein
VVVVVRCAGWNRRDDWKEGWGLWLGRWDISGFGFWGVLDDCLPHYYVVINHHWQIVQFEF